MVASETVGILEATLSPLPRGTCPACHRDVALRVGGLVREHRVYLPQLDQDLTTRRGRLTVCEGAGRPAWSPDTIEAAAIIVSPGHCSEHPDVELVNHRRAGIQRWGEDPPTVCTSVGHYGDLDGRERCLWCGGRLIPPGTPTWATTHRRSYCKPHHRLLAFRARQAATP